MTEPSYLIGFRLDGRSHTGRTRARESLADYLLGAGLGVNVGCDEGTCGTCLVRLDGRLTRSCLTLAVQVDGRQVDTVRRLAPDGDLGPVQQAISWHAGIQCGFCSPAFALTISELARRGEPADKLAEYLSCVSCRCTGYAGLLAATRDICTGGDVNRPQARREDVRLLTGQGHYLSTIRPPGCLWAKVVRADRAPAALTNVDTAAALAIPGVVAVYTAADLPAGARLLPMAQGDAVEPVLAADEVAYTGQPVAIVVANDAYLAEDGAEAVRVTYEPLISSSATSDCRVAQQVGDPSALSEPDVVTIRATFTVSRQTAMPLEPRGLVAVPEDGGLTIHGYTKRIRSNTERLCQMLKLDVDRVRVAAVDVGGAFGVKGEFYPEDVLVPFAALRLGKPVKWIEDRSEHMTAANHSRGQTWTVLLAARRNGMLLGAKVEVLSDIGAYRRSLTSLVPYLGTAMFPGPYRLPVFHATITEQTSARTPIGPYRAPGRFEANFARERALDLLATRLAMPLAEFRMRNLLAPSDLPYDTGTANEGPVVYDEADFPAAFGRALELLAREDRTAPPGCRRGIATVPFVDKAGIGPQETAVVTVRADGSVLVEVDSAPSGQGHETTFATIAAEVLGVRTEQVAVLCGDTASAGQGLGTFASRGATMTGNAVLLAASNARECPATPEGERRGLGCFEFDGHTYPYGAVGTVVDVDLATFAVTVRRLVIVCDAGRILDERVVRGQLAGAAVQGLGGALLEELQYDSGGQPLTTRLADYLMPLAADVPEVEVVLIGGSASATPLGVRGIGEAGIAAIGAVVASAVSDAIPEIAEAVTELPITPSRLRAAWQAACERATEASR